MPAGVDGVVADEANVSEESGENVKELVGSSWRESGTINAQMGFSHE